MKLPLFSWDFPKQGILDTIFNQTWFRVQIVGWPQNGYTITLGQFLIMLVLALIVIGVSNWLLKGKGKISNIVVGVIITLIGAYLIQGLTTSLPTVLLIGGVRIVYVLVGSIIIGVFYELIRGRFSKAK